MKKHFIYFVRISGLFLVLFSGTGTLSAQKKTAPIDVSGFYDSDHHFKDITDHEQVITPVEGQVRYDPAQVKGIADNILLYQQPNGGWPKNYDMRAILTPDQKSTLTEHRDSNRTTIDNGATYSQTEYLSGAWLSSGDSRYEAAALRGIGFMLGAQYGNGGWPQFYPSPKGYQKYITFNDDAMVGVMNVFHHILLNEPSYAFVSSALREKIKIAFDKGIDCILKCQIREGGRLTSWCQQYDSADLHPTGARTFELASKAAEESSRIVELLMSVDHPGPQIIMAVRSAMDWFKKVEIKGIVVTAVAAPKKAYKYHTTSQDRVVTADSAAPPIWTRYYELGTDRPLFANRDGKKMYRLSDVSRERRTGYAWYGYWPEKLLNTAYGKWLEKIK
jgi:PelA/Pel-15E family pectate lyase